MLTQQVILCLCHSRLFGLVEASDGEVVHHLLHLLQVVFDPVKLLPQVVVLEIELPAM